MGPAGHAQSPATLSGSVVDATGSPIAGAIVTLRGAGEQLTPTDAEGQFVFLNLPAGEYELTVVRSGFAPARQTTRLRAGEPSRVSLTLSVPILEQTVVTADEVGRE